MGPMIEVAAGPWTQQQTEGQGTRDPPAPRGAGAFTQSPAGQDSDPTSHAEASGPHLP